MLSKEIENAQVRVRTDAYQMSVGEIVSMYKENEIIIDPEFQRLFRWKIGQKSKLIESLLLGIPLPSVFVFEREDGVWELIDGLQRISTILEFMGRLRSPNGGREPPSALAGTKYLPSLHNAVWEEDEMITQVPINEQCSLEKSQQLAIRRGRIGVEILKSPSDELTKYEMFQRLNAGGTLANPQEIRNCIILMVNKEYFRTLKTATDNPSFQKVFPITEDQEYRQRRIEIAVRFLVHANVEYDGRLDVEEYIDEGIVHLAQEGNHAQAVSQISRTFQLLDFAKGGDALKRYQDGRHAGKIGLVALEGIAVGVCKNIDAITELGEEGAHAFIKEKIEGFWSHPKNPDFTAGGLRGTSRIQLTVPFGADWFKP